MDTSMIYLLTNITTMKNNIKLTLVAMIATTFGAFAQSISSNSYVRNENNRDVTYHLFWNPQVGNSQLYSWSPTEAKYTAAVIGLPSNPLQGVKGKVWVNSYVNQGKSFHLYWDTKTGKAQLYSWDGTKYAGAVNGLPDAPLPGAKGEVLIRSYVNNNVAHHLFWDTETGATQLYRWNGAEAKYTAAVIGLPTNLLPGAKGKIMINSYVRDGVASHLAWDTETGNSQLYLWNASQAKYTVAEIGIPANPLPNAKGEIMVRSYLNNNKVFHLFWDTETGSSKLYSWNDAERKYTAAVTNLPETPLQNVKGKIMVNSYVNNGKTFHLFYDTESGASKVYSWDASQAKYTAAQFDLPQEPLK